jgi:predicted nucleic acid-binding protein
MEISREGFSPVVDVDSKIAVSAAQIKHKHSMPFADSIVAATAKALHAPCFTDDPHFESINDVSLKWMN